MEVEKEQEQIKEEVDVQKLNLKDKEDKMALGDNVGGLLGGLMVLGVGMWGVKKIGEALDSNDKPSKSLLDDTEPF